MAQYRFFYHLKPFIPRRVQIFLRRQRANRIAAKLPRLWFIDDMCGTPPHDWNGWPGNAQFALVLTHDVEEEDGQEKCIELMELERNLGFRSAFNFIPERYSVSQDIRETLLNNGFEVGVHDLNHDGKLFMSRRIFDSRYQKINRYLDQWNAKGFRSGAMFRNLDWIYNLDISYDASTFDIDPFEPQPEGSGTIFPHQMPPREGHPGYTELPYTLPQDFTLYVILRNKTIDAWKQKLDWIVGKGGMALLVTHPDYMCFNGKSGLQHYPVDLYRSFLEYVNNTYKGRFWSALPGEVARFMNGGNNRIHQECDTDLAGKR